MNDILKDDHAAARPASAAPARQPQTPWLKPVLEIGPLALFVFANAKPKLFEPLAARVLPEIDFKRRKRRPVYSDAGPDGRGLAALAASFALTRRLPIVPLMTAVLVLAFGALTLYLHDATFIKMKPTILYICFSVALFGGLAFNRPVLPILFDSAFALSERGWRRSDPALGVFFPCARGGERNRLADAIHRLSGSPSNFRGCSFWCFSSRSRNCH